MAPANQEIQFTLSEHSAMQQLTPDNQDQTEISDPKNGPKPALVVDELARRRWRFWMIAGTFSFLAVIIVIQLVRYQIFRGDDLWSIPETVSPPAARGVIVDRDGELLAIDRFYYQVTATPSHIKTDEARREVAHELERLIGLPADETMQILLENKERDFAILAKEISLEQGKLLREEREQQEETLALFPLQDVHLTPMPRRFYPQQELACQVVGFVRAERFGFTAWRDTTMRFCPQMGWGLPAGAPRRWTICRPTPDVIFLPRLERISSSLSTARSSGSSKKSWSRGWKSTRPQAAPSL
ncbi:MAG: hypothetical protein HC802_02765 [Caldilineaceae bacterium]|nr:hypothetical protein [Caldilineaceae bacterium]